MILNNVLSITEFIFPPSLATSKAIFSFKKILQNFFCFFVQRFSRSSRMYFWFYTFSKFCSSNCFSFLKLIFLFFDKILLKNLGIRATKWHKKSEVRLKTKFKLKTYIYRQGSINYYGLWKDIFLIKNPSKYIFFKFWKIRSLCPNYCRFVIIITHDSIYLFY